MTPCFQNMNRRGRVRRQRNDTMESFSEPKERRARGFRSKLKDLWSYRTAANIGQGLSRVSECRQLALLVAPARANWKQANSNPSWLERHDAAVPQRVNELGQVREQRSRQRVRLPAAFAAKLDEGRLSRRTHREQRSEISIRGNEDSTLGGSAIKDHIVVGVLQSYRANVDCIMTGLLQESGERW